MYFPQSAEYALRAMVYLASLPSGELLSGHELGRRAEVPTHYLAKILRRMVVAGLLTSRRGHQGGFRLTRPAEEILIVELLEAVDQVPNTSRCAFGWDRCSADHPCPLHGAWTELTDAFDKWAHTTTLGHVAWPAERLEQLLEQRGGRRSGHGQRPFGPDRKKTT